ncbi:MAG: glycosyltransferase family 2 protein [Steroidobacteraceae bacterium]
MRFEVRVPAYERPAMLLRALRSLQGQTHGDWTAIVYDDSRTAAAREVVEQLADGRIRYVHNAARLGAARNIDQCFAPEPQGGGAAACLLEDDNFWQPGFIDAAAAALRQGVEPLVMMNQRVNDETGGLRHEDDTTRGRWFADGLIDPLVLRASLLFMEGVSNGGLVWRLGAGVDLRVGPAIVHTGLQEACRTLLIPQRMRFVSRAEAVWTALPKQDTARRDEGNRLIGRGMQSVRRHVLARDGRAVVDAARALAERVGLRDALGAAVWHSAGLRAWQWREAVGFDPVALLKGWALRNLEPDPCAGFLATRSSRG